MAMIDDLDRAGDVLDTHPTVRAIAGDLVARQRLHGEIEGALDVSMLDAIQPIRRADRDRRQSVAGEYH